MLRRAGECYTSQTKGSFSAAALLGCQKSSISFSNPKKSLDLSNASHFCRQDHGEIPVSNMHVTPCIISLAHAAFACRSFRAIPKHRDAKIRRHECLSSTRIQRGLRTRTLTHAARRSFSTSSSASNTSSDVKSAATPTERKEVLLSDYKPPEFLIDVRLVDSRFCVPPRKDEACGSEYFSFLRRSAVAPL